MVMGVGVGTGTLVPTPPRIALRRIAFHNILKHRGSGSRLLLCILPSCYMAVLVAIWA